MFRPFYFVTALLFCQKKSNSKFVLIFKENCARSFWFFDKINKSLRNDRSSLQSTQSTFTDIRNSRNSALFAKWTRAQSARHRIKIWKRQNPWALSQFAINKETEFKKAFLFMLTEKYRSTFLPIAYLFLNIQIHEKNSWKFVVLDVCVISTVQCYIWTLGRVKKAIKESSYISTSRKSNCYVGPL